MTVKIHSFILLSNMLKRCVCFVYQQEICKKLHAAIDKIDEARYDAEAKVQKADTEVRHDAFR